MRYLLARHRQALRCSSVLEMTSRDFIGPTTSKLASSGVDRRDRLAPRGAAGVRPNLHAAVHRARWRHNDNRGFPVNWHNLHDRPDYQRPLLIRLFAERQATRLLPRPHQRLHQTAPETAPDRLLLASYNTV